MIGTRPGGVFEDVVGQRLTLSVGQGELLGVVRQDTDAIHTGIDQEIDHPALAREIDLAALIEGCRCDREDASESLCSHVPPASARVLRLSTPTNVGNG